MRRSIAFATGAPDRLQPHDITNVPEFTEYARQELGVSYPVGKGRRESWMAFAKEEIEIQMWAMEDLVRTVDYIKGTGQQCRTLQGILWYVDAARGWSSQRRSTAYVDLHAKVARALQVEDDTIWIRRLSLAQGNVLEGVYAEWEAERSERYAGVADHRDGDRLQRDVPVDRPVEGGNTSRRYLGGIKVGGVLPLEA